MKLSKAQQRVMDEAKQRIDEARTIGFESWWEWYGNGIDECRGDFRAMYEAYRMGVICLQADTRTIKSLEALGLIKIVELFGTVDTIKVLNY